jgi:flagellar basal-body rod modification protein FlgD
VLAAETNSMSSINSLLPPAVTNGTAGVSNTNSFNSLSPSDFIGMMITQLQNQDPLDPTNSQDLLSQMSSIGQLESSDQLQTSLTSITMQNQISSASSLIGKEVQGTDASNNAATGLVGSISISQIPASQSSTGAAQTNVTLNLTSGDTMPLANVQAIAQPNTTGTATAAPASLMAAPAAMMQSVASGASNVLGTIVNTALSPLSAL